MSGTAHADTVSRQPVLPGCSRSCPGTHGFPCVTARPRCPKETSLIFSSSCPAAQGSSTSHLIVSGLQVCHALQHERSWKMLFYYDVIVIKGLNKWLSSSMCSSDRASLLTLLDKRLVGEHLLWKEGERQALVVSSIPNQWVLFLVLTGIEFPISQLSPAVLCVMFL